MFTANDIRETGFSKAGISGYKAADVDEFNCYSQFVNALAKHIYTPDKEMERRFVKAIKHAK